jgi:hypothetical protein
MSTTLNSKITNKLNDLTAKYELNISTIAEYNTQILSILSSNQSIIGDKQNELSSITNQIINTKEQISNTEKLISSKISIIKELPAIKHKIIFKEQTIHSNEILRIETKIKDIEAEHTATQQALETQLKIYQSSKNTLIQLKQDLETQGISLQSAKTSLRHSVLSTVHNKKASKASNQTLILETSDTITSILKEIDATKELIETKKTDKLNVNICYYNTQESISLVDSKLKHIDIQILDILNGVNHTQDFELTLNNLYSDRTFYQNELEILRIKPENDITGMMQSKDNEIVAATQQLKWLDSHLQYHQERCNEIQASIASNAPSSETTTILQSIIIHKKRYDEVKLNLSTTIEQIENITRQIEDHNATKNNTLETLEEQRTRAILRLDTMKTRSSDEMKDNETTNTNELESLRTTLETLKLTYATLENSKSIIETNIYNSISLSTNPEVSSIIKDLQHKIIKLERINILLSKEISILHQHQQQK